MKAKLVGTAKGLMKISYVRYLTVGGTAFFLDYSVLLVLKEVVGVNTAVAAAAGFLTGFVASFVLNRAWAFVGGKDRRSHIQLIEYTALVVFNLLFTVVVLELLDETFAVALLKPAVTAVITLWNYFIYKLVIFREVDEED